MPHVYPLPTYGKRKTFHTGQNYSLVKLPGFIDPKTKVTNINGYQLRDDHSPDIA